MSPYSSFERGRCNNPGNLGVHNMLIHTKPLPSFIHPVLKGGDATNNLGNLGVHNMLIHTKPLPSFIHPVLKGGDATTYAT
jgi:hypothetical protein